jgi:hypothetical protein
LKLIGQSVQKSQGRRLRRNRDLFTGVEQIAKTDHGVHRSTEGRQLAGEKREDPVGGGLNSREMTTLEVDVAEEGQSDRWYRGE